MDALATANDPLFLRVEYAHQRIAELRRRTNDTLNQAQASREKLLFMLNFLGSSQHHVVRAIRQSPLCITDIRHASSLLRNSVFPASSLLAEVDSYLDQLLHRLAMCLADVSLPSYRSAREQRTTHQRSAVRSTFSNAEMRCLLEELENISATLHGDLANSNTCEGRNTVDHLLEYLERYASGTDGKSNLSPPRDTDSQSGQRLQASGLFDRLQQTLLDWVCRKELNYRADMLVRGRLLGMGSTESPGTSLPASAKRFEADLRQGIVDLEAQLSSQKQHLQNERAFVQNLLQDVSTLEEAIRQVQRKGEEAEEQLSKQHEQAEAEMNKQFEHLASALQRSCRKLERELAVESEKYREQKEFFEVEYRNSPLHGDVARLTAELMPTIEQLEAVVEERRLLWKGEGSRMSSAHNNASAAASIERISLPSVRLTLREARGNASLDADTSTDVTSRRYLLVKDTTTGHYHLLKPNGVMLPREVMALECVGEDCHGSFRIAADTSSWLLKVSSSPLFSK